MEKQPAPHPEPSAAAIGAAMEIARSVSVLPIYSHALGESFANIIERHTRCRELVVACHLARAALSRPDVYSEAAKKQRDTALAAVEKVLSNMESIG